VPERSDEHTTATLEPFSARGAGPRRVTLVVYHRDGTELVPLEVGREVVIGRAPTADVHVPDRSLSRLHARVRHDSEGLLIEDLGSRNGTLVNGARIEQARIRTGDDVLLGSARLAVHALDAVDPHLEGIDSHERFLLLSAGPGASAARLPCS
jgi:pSer/pThr/pTyr-binding forkhead associated (FHA) protein